MNDTEIRTQIQALRDRLYRATTIRAWNNIRKNVKKLKHELTGRGDQLNLKNEIVLLQIETERAIGRGLNEVISQGGDRKSQESISRLTVRSFGLTHRQSSEFQKLAKLDRAAIDDYFALVDKLGVQSSPHGLLTFVNRNSYPGTNCQLAEEQPSRERKA